MFVSDESLTSNEETITNTRNNENIGGDGINGDSLDNADWSMDNVSTNTKSTTLTSDGAGGSSSVPNQQIQHRSNRHHRSYKKSPKRRKSLPSQCSSSDEPHPSVILIPRGPLICYNNESLENWLPDRKFFNQVCNNTSLSTINNASLSTANSAANNNSATSKILNSIAETNAPNDPTNSDAAKLPSTTPTTASSKVQTNNQSPILIVDDQPNKSSASPKKEAKFIPLAKAESEFEPNEQINLTTKEAKANEPNLYTLSSSAIHSSQSIDSATQKHKFNSVNSSSPSAQLAKQHQTVSNSTSVKVKGEPAANENNNNHNSTSNVELSRKFEKKNSESILITNTSMNRSVTQNTTKLPNTTKPVATPTVASSLISTPSSTNSPTTSTSSLSSAVKPNNSVTTTITTTTTTKASTQVTTGTAGTPTNMSAVNRVPPPRTGKLIPRPIETIAFKPSRLELSIKPVQKNTLPSRIRVESECDYRSLKDPYHSTTTNENFYSSNDEENDVFVKLKEAEQVNVIFNYHF